jgi:hypothetical protein
MSGQAIIRISIYMPDGFDCMTEEDLNAKSAEIAAETQKQFDDKFPSLGAEVIAVGIER